MDITHKVLLTQLARDHAKQMHASLQLARAHFNPDHPTVIELERSERLARDTVEAIEREPARIAA